MTVGTERHDLLVNAINVQLVQGLRGGPCGVFPHNRKLLTADGNVYYPDSSSIARPLRTAATRTMRFSWSRSSHRPTPATSSTTNSSTTWPCVATRLHHGRPGVRCVTIYERHDLGWRSRMATRRADVKVEGFALDLAQAFADVEGQATT